jgi:hypothetical protein
MSDAPISSRVPYVFMAKSLDRSPRCPDGAKNATSAGDDQARVADRSPSRPRCLAAEPNAFDLVDLAHHPAVNRRFQARAGLEVLLWRIDVEQKT